MPRTTTDLVRAAIDTDLAIEEIDLFVRDANAWVTHFLAGEGLSTDRLARIEKYLACHYLTLRDPRLRSSKVGDVTDTFQRDTQVTEYLKQAVAEDPTGIVKARLMLQKESGTVSFRHAGFAAGT